MTPLIVRRDLNPEEGRLVKDRLIAYLEERPDQHVRAERMAAFGERHGWAWVKGLLDLRDSIIAGGGERSPELRPDDAPSGSGPVRFEPARWGRKLGDVPEKQEKIAKCKQCKALGVVFYRDAETGREWTQPCHYCRTVQTRSQWKAVVSASKKRGAKRQEESRYRKGTDDEEGA